MPDVFVSYAHQDVSRVEALVDLLETSGLTVWWDRKISPGSRFEEVIDQALGSAATVLIALTRHAAGSDWVRAETAAARHHNRVIPVLLDDVQVPLSLRTLQVSDLRRWPEGAQAEVAQLLSAIAAGGETRTDRFVGRHDALRLLEESFETSLKGQGTLTVVTGEPGIGKTRCLEELGRLAEEQGALVLWGRCLEQQGAPPYWPWVQILREYVEGTSADELRLLLGGSLDAVGSLVPELAARLGTKPQEAEVSDRFDQRFHLFDALSRVFGRAASAVPLVLMLDDLHWADASSLALLEFLVQDVHRHRLLVVCAYRDVEVTRRSPLFGTLGELSRSGKIRRIRLGGLSREETGELTSVVTGFRLNASTVEAIFQQTDGNPLFVREVAKVIADEYASAGDGIIAVDVPDGVREAIGRRLNRLSERCNELLGIASVVGREFALPLVARIAGRPVQDCLSELDAAVASGILTPQGTSGGYRFTHALIRETLYEEIPTLERLQLHLQVSRALQEIHGDDLEPALSQIVHHACEASVLGDHQSAVDLAIRAAERAERLFALDEASQLYLDALRVLEANGEGRTELAGRVHYAIGWLANVLGRIESAASHLSQSMDIARRLGNGGLFTRAAVLRVRITASSQADFDGVALIDEALAMLPVGSGADRAMALGHRVLALRRTGDIALIERAASEAIAFAREVGDTDVLVRVIRQVVIGTRGFPRTLETRIAHCAECLNLIDEAADSEEFAEACYFQMLNLMEAGELDRFEALLETHSRVASKYSLARQHLQSELLGGALDLARGNWAEAERRIEQALETGKRLADSTHDAEGVYGTQMFVLNRDLGRLEGMTPLIRRMIDDAGSRLWTPGVMLLCCEVGLLDVAREKLDELSRGDFALVPRDDVWLTCIAFCAETCARLNEAGCAEVLLELLVPYEGQTAVQPTAACYGAVERYLGLLARVLGWDADARRYLDCAVARNRSMRAWPMLARTQLDLARLLLGTGTEPDQASGRQLLAESEQLATRFGMKSLLRQIAAELHTGEPVWPDELTAREVDVIRLLAIGRSNKDIATVLGISLSTVATHVRSILTKTGCANRTEAAAYAIRNDLKLNA